MTLGDAKRICESKMEKKLKDDGVFFVLCYSALLRVSLFCTPKKLISNLPGETQRFEYYGGLRYPIAPTKLEEHLDIDDPLCSAVVSFVCADMIADPELKKYYDNDAMLVINMYEAMRVKETSVLEKRTRTQR